MRICISKKWLFAISALAVLMLQSCNSKREFLVIPHSVSTASSVPFKDLNLKTGEYSILKTITESASVRCEFKNNEIKVIGGDGDFTYTFRFNNGSWSLAKFSGAAELGYFAEDFIASPSEIPNTEEFARRVAMSKIIGAMKDFHADAVVEPVVVTKVNNLGNNTVEYLTTISAKLVVIK